LINDISGKQLTEEEFNKLKLDGKISADAKYSDYKSKNNAKRAAADKKGGNTAKASTVGGGSSNSGTTKTPPPDIQAVQNSSISNLSNKGVKGENFELYINSGTYSNVELGEKVTDSNLDSIYQNSLKGATAQFGSLLYFNERNRLAVRDGSGNWWYVVYTSAGDKTKGDPHKEAIAAAKLQVPIKYETGGLADFTGPAWLDGTKSRPELVLNARDTQNFI
jgi:hypothetical protein